MSYELPTELISVFNQHLQKGAELLNAATDRNSTRMPRLGFWARYKVNKAIEHFKKCLAVMPQHWQARWLMGKAYQGLGDHTRALACFVEAQHQQPTDLDVLREAAVSAMSVGQPELAATYSATAVAMRPNDAKLWGNHAINLLVIGEDQLAAQAIEKALHLSPEDEINQESHRIIQRVSAGQAPRPSWRDVR